MSIGSFETRKKTLLSFLLMWAAVVAAHISYFSVAARGRLLEEARSLSSREGRLPAPRGRILDKEGVPLAWTELYSDLVLESLPEGARRRRSLELALSKRVGIESIAGIHAGTSLKRSLSPDEIVSLEPLLRAYPELKVKPRVERCSIEYPEVRRKLGRTVVESGTPKGVEGLEMEFEHLLSGLPGRFEVMIDRRGNWIDGTLRILERPEAGKDVSVGFSVVEARGGGFGGNGDGGGTH